MTFDHRHSSLACAIAGAVLVLGAACDQPMGAEDAAAGADAGRDDAGTDGGDMLAIDGGAGADASSGDAGFDGGAATGDAGAGMGDAGVDGSLRDAGFDGSSGDAGDDGGASDAGDDGGASDAGVDGGASTPDAGGACIVPTLYPTIAAALADVACDGIFVLAGTYAENLVIARSVAIVGQGRDAVVIDGSASGSVVTIASGTTVRLASLTITNGLATDGGGVKTEGALTLEDVAVSNNEVTVTDFGPGAGYGGGIHCANGELTLRRTLVAGNTARRSPTSFISPSGGGIYATACAVEVLEASAITGNTVSASDTPSVGGRGGGICIEAASTLRIAASTVSDNDVTITSVESDATATGGGIDATGGGSVTLEAGAVVARNELLALAGGFMFARAYVNGGGIHLSETPLVATRTSIVDNHADGDGPILPPLVLGGGVEVNNASVTLTECVLARNRARSLRTLVGTAAGGGLRFSGNRNGPRLDIARSTFSDNVCTAGLMEGGGLAISYRDRDVEVVIDQSTFSGNSAYYGGGLAVYASGGNDATVYVSGSTFSANAGTFGGALHLSNNVDLHARSTIVYGNTASSMGPDCYTDDGARLLSAGYNVFQDTTACGVVGTATGDQFGVDPMLAALADNGGPTETHAIGAGGSAHERGDPAGCLDHLGAAFTIDQRGAPRPIGRCDVGAVELP